MIKKAGMEEKSKDLAIEFEKSYFQISKKEGEKYATVAYNNMRKFKTRLGELSEKGEGKSITEYFEKELKALTKSTAARP